MYAIVKFSPLEIGTEAVDVCGVSRTYTGACTAMKEVLLDSIRNGLRETEKGLFRAEIYVEAPATGGKWLDSGLTSPDELIRYITDDVGAPIGETYVFDHNEESCFVMEVRSVRNLDKP